MTKSDLIQMGANVPDDAEIAIGSGRTLDFPQSVSYGLVMGSHPTVVFWKAATPKLGVKLPCAELPVLAPVATAVKEGGE